MTKTFATTLEKIKGDAPTFASLDERAVEIGVVLPILGRLGWNIENISEIYPQRGLSDGTKVDYDLQIGGESRVLIEVKRWAHTLNDEDEAQLAGYCRLAKPKLAILTSGSTWRLCLPPTKSKSAPLRRFKELDITSMPSDKAERDLKQFLARDSLVNYNPTIAVARTLYKELESYKKFSATLIDSWNALANDKCAQASLVVEFMQSKGIPTNWENVMRFIESLTDPIVVVVPPTGNSSKKPASFTLLSSPAGKNKKNFILDVYKSWRNLLIAICIELNNRHPNVFRRKVLSMKHWFADAKDAKFSVEIGQLGLYVKKTGSSKDFRDACFDIVAKFDYPKGSLEIKDSSGAEL